MTTTENRPDVDDPFVIEGEVVDEHEPGRVTHREHRHGRLHSIRCRAQAHVVTLLPDRGVVGRSKRAAGAVARGSARASWTTGQGFVSWSRRLADGLTYGRHREALRYAQLHGDREMLKEWTELLESAKDKRQARLLALPREALSLVIMATGAVALVSLLLFVGGVFAWLNPGGLGWASWWAAVGDFVVGVVDFVRTVVGIALWGSPFLLLFMAWNEGKRAAITPMWLMTDDERAEAQSTITADGITQALMHLKVPALSKALKEGATLDFVVNPREQGGGTYFQVRLPLGVMAAELLPRAKVELLAGNLNRHLHECWPQRQPDADARVLDCWVADKGTLDRPAPPWPLLHDGEFDVFRDRAPYGVTMRSEPIAVGLLQKHWLIGATSKQGKTTVVRSPAMALALDPTVELKIADLKGDGDWSMFRERASTLIEGQSDDEAEATCVMLEDAVAEMDRRYAAKRAAGIVGPITRELSRKRGSGFHPLYLVIDECQVLYAAPHPIGGTKDDARAWRAAKRLHDQARAVNIHLWQATQRPDNRTLPVMVREGAHVRGALNVPNEATAKMVLADAAERGARPQDLRPGADRGTVVLTGDVEDLPAGQAFLIVRTYYVDTPECYPVLARATAAWKAYGNAPADEPAAEPVDHLANVRAAMRDEQRVRTTVVLGRLLEDHDETYDGWTRARFGDLLDEHGIPVRKSDGQRVIRLDDVDDAIVRQAWQGSPEGATSAAGSGS